MNQAANNKSSNNFQKEIQRSVAVIISFILISLTVSAQPFWKDILTNSIFGEIAFALVDNHEGKEIVITSTDLYYTQFLDSYAEPVSEELELEEWMISETYFNGEMIYLEEATESQLELENWLTNNKYFNQYETTKILKIENEEENSLELESWMFVANLWSI